MKKATAWLVTVVFVLLGFLFVLTAEAQMGSSPKDRARPIGPTAPGTKGPQETAGRAADPAQCVASGR